MAGCVLKSELRSHLLGGGRKPGGVTFLPGYETLSWQENRLGLDDLSRGLIGRARYDRVWTISAIVP